MSNLNERDAQLKREQQQRDAELTEARARREDKRLDKTLREDPVIRNARDLMLQESKSQADKMAISKAFENPRQVAPDMRQRMNDAMRQAQKNESVKRDTAGKKAEESFRAASNMAFEQRVMAAIANAKATQASKPADIEALRGAINALTERTTQLRNQLDALVGTPDLSRVQFGITLDKNTPYVTAGNDRRIELGIKYSGDWAVSYKGHTDGTISRLGVTKGYFQLGPYRQIATGDYTLGPASAAGDHVVVARQEWATSTPPTVALLTVANYLADTSHYFGGYQGQQMIARLTSTLTDGTYVFSNLVQTHYGEITCYGATLKPDTKYNVATVDGSGGNVWWRSEWTRAY